MSYLGFSQCQQRHRYVESMPSDDSYVHRYEKTHMQVLNVAYINKGLYYYGSLTHV